ncbi:response regulator [bacterium]|nr:response regulator [bacterium]
MANERILIIDDEVDNLYLLQMRLQASDFSVITASNPLEGIGIAIDERPDLILLDLKMPQMDGFEVCRKLKSNLSTSQIPIIILTCQDDVTDKVKGLEGGADDYLIKDEIDYREIAARIRSVLRRTENSIAVNPLTHLPGNKAIDTEIHNRINTGARFTVGYVDIDNFKAFNDVYGYKKGDKIILLLAEIISNVLKYLGDEQDFVGHIGGDDFLFISASESSEKVASRLVYEFGLRARNYYNEDHVRQGGFYALDRTGVEHFFPLLSVTVALIPDAQRFANLDEIALEATKIKRRLKNEGGNRYGAL